LRQKGASPIGVCAAAIMGATMSAPAKSMDVARTDLSVCCGMVPRCLQNESSP
jgi:hypothetical protein